MILIAFDYNVKAALKYSDVSVKYTVFISMVQNFHHNF